MMDLTQVYEYMGDGYNITEFICVRVGNKDYNIDRVYLEDFADGLYQIVIQVDDA